MPTVPRKTPEMITWFHTRQPLWVANADALGLSADEAAEMGERIAAAADALRAQQAAQQAAQAATLKLNLAAEAMGALGANLIRKIRATAGQTGDGEVYGLGGVPPPAAPSPLGPPGRPDRFAVALSQTGALALTWRCRHPAGASGTRYEVYRRTGADGPFAYLGGTGERRFVDDTVPPGAAHLTYQVRGVRSTAVGPWAQFVVNFGTAAGGARAVSVAPKAAA